MSRAWEGHYLDGRSAARQTVSIRPMREALHFTTTDDQTHIWLYSAIRQTQGAYAGSPVRFEYGAEISEALVVPNPEFLTALHNISPELTGHLHDPSRRHVRLKRTIVAAIGTLVVGAFLYLWGIPALAGVVTRLVPVTWEQRLGAAVATQVAPKTLRCTDPPRLAVIRNLVTTLSAAVQDDPYSVDVIVVDRPHINALAVPAGPIVIYRGLLEKTARPEQLAGVLAHELQHIHLHHTTRALIEHASTSLLLSAVTGEFSESAPYGLEAAHVMGLLQYSRAHEREADTEGMRLLALAGFDPIGMVEFFEVLQKNAPGAPDLLEYMSTHPSTETRIEYLKDLAHSLARTPASTEARIASSADWKEIRSLCQTRPPRPEITP